ncbi:MAG: homocysteine S-methyltransferase [Micrococcales bacterium]
MLESPDLIVQAHRNFVEAGAEVVITSSYQVSRRGFQEIGLTAEEADLALTNSVKAARAAVAGTSTKVAASIGPFGAVLHDGSEYRGNYGVSEEELTQFHAERIKVLEAAGPDILLAETIPDLLEAHALAVALEKTSLPVWISFTAGEADSLWSGDRIEDAVAAVSAIPTLEAIGFNCVNPNLVTELVTRVRAVSDIAVVIYPNKGGSWDAAAGEWGYQEQKTLEGFWQEWKNLDVAYVGGCCGLDSRDIENLAKAVSA